MSKQSKKLLKLIRKHEKNKLKYKLSEIKRKSETDLFNSQVSIISSMSQAQKLSLISLLFKKTEES